ncbi:tripartite tricarboxylate transporter substrate binding protein [uncultured Aquincola sp.]|uniref:Bug family tripartite tricarboxylate transporter substrate binding protein n=1 Tax=uncultured Aquincola sp. TaxID=886556 RepID=UPI0032B19B7E
MRRRSIPLLAVALALALAAGQAQAQELPRKPITLVVGFAAGGAADAAARMIAKKLQANIGQTVVVDNRAGAGGNIAHQFVAKAEPDGSVILLGSIGPLTIAPHLMKVGYDPFKDLAPLTMGVSFPNVLVVHQGVGVKTLAEFVAKAKAQPGKLDFASTGAGSASHLAGELLNQRAGIDTVHIPYKGGAPALQDLLGGRVAAYYSTPATAAPHIESGKLVPLATTGLQRSEFMPQVPTVAESGYPGFAATNWYAFMAPGKTPVPVLERWNQELVKALRDPEVKAELDHHGLTPAPGTRQQLADYIASESRTWGQLVRERGIKAD